MLNIKNDIGEISYDAYSELYDAISMISADPKIGHWINIDATHSKYDRCGAIFEIASENGEVNYCPNCRCHMVEPQKKQCADCNHYGKFSLDCGRCDDDCSMFEPQESEEKNG